MVPSVKDLPPKCGPVFPQNSHKSWVQQCRLLWQQWGKRGTSSSAEVTGQLAQTTGEIPGQGGTLSEKTEHAVERHGRLSSVFHTLMPCAHLYPCKRNNVHAAFYKWSSHGWCVRQSSGGSWKCKTSKQDYHSRTLLLQLDPQAWVHISLSAQQCMRKTPYPSICPRSKAINIVNQIEEDNQPGGGAFNLNTQEPKAGGYL